MKINTKKEYFAPSLRRLYIAIVFTNTVNILVNRIWQSVHIHTKPMDVKINP